MIVIVEYGIGNTGSIRNMLKKVGVEAKISSNADEIESSTKLILPGVGAFDTAMQQLAATGLIPLLNHKVLEEKTPVLGVCLGMQMLTESSEEGNLAGLAWIRGKVKRFRFEEAWAHLRVPHMGWNEVAFPESSKLFQGFKEEARFYFVHSYHVVCDNEADIAATAHYGYEIVASIEHENIFGVQFHPEKSHKFGMRLYRNFVEAR